MRIDLGDAQLDINLRIPGLKPGPAGLRWRLGVQRGTTPGDREVHMRHQAPATGRIDVTMDLQADQQVPLSVQFTDEVGNPVDPPSGGSTVAYTVDDPTIINLTDNGDGTATAAAVGPLGTANVHADVSFDGQTLSGDLQIVVVAGLAERVSIVAGDPTEVTPD